MKYTIIHKGPWRAMTVEVATLGMAIAIAEAKGEAFLVALTGSTKALVTRA